MPELTLFYFPLSSCSRKVLFSLFEKKLEFKSVIINLPAGEQRKPNFLAINPHGKVPVLQYGKEYIFDSAVILEFIEECFPMSPLLPADPLQKAIVRKHTQYADQFFYPAISAILAELRVPQEKLELLRLNNHLTLFHNQYLPYLETLINNRTGSFLFGNLSLADLAFAMGLIRLKETAGNRLTLTTATQDWMQFIQDLKPYKMLALTQTYHQGEKNVANQ